jgi:hypothetical protein
MAGAPAETGGVAKRYAGVSIEKYLTVVKKNHKNIGGARP